MMSAPIMVPVDLAHTEGLDKSLRMAAELAIAFNAPMTLISVTEAGPTEVATTEDGYAAALDDFAAKVADRFGLRVDAKTVHTVDVVAELGDRLVGAASDMGAEAIVMASHVPGFMEHIFASNAGYVASHAKCSVFVVR